MAVVATYHDGNVSKIYWKSIDIVVDLSCYLGEERSSICFAGKSAFLRVDLMMDDTGVGEPIRLSNFELWEGDFEVVEWGVNILIMLMCDIGLM